MFLTRPQARKRAQKITKSAAGGGAALTLRAAKRRAKTMQDFEKRFEFAHKQSTKGDRGWRRCAHLMFCMLSNKRLKRKIAPYATRLAGLTHPHRLAIAYLLSHTSMHSKEISFRLDLAQNLVSHHLAHMLRTGWITKTRYGQRILYELDKKGTEKFFNEMKNNVLASSG